MDDEETKRLTFKYVTSSGLTFESEDCDTIKCGQCQNYYSRIVSHLKNTCKGCILPEEMEHLKQKLERQRKRKQQKKWRENAKRDNLHKYVMEERKKNIKYYRKRIKLVGSWDRLERFRRATKYGPIFVCSSCDQKLFQHEVVTLEESFEIYVNKTYDGAFTKFVNNKVPISLLIKVGDKVTRTEASYICKSCKRFLGNGRMPKLSKNNGLQVDPIPEEIPKLTELESNLIAKNLIFQKYHKMPKSRWSGTHDRMVNIPIHNGDILNTIEKLPRTPTEAGIVPMKIIANLKRKL